MNTKKIISTQIREDLQTYLNKRTINANEFISRDTELFDSAILDSFELISLVFYVEDKYHIELKHEDINVKNFSSVDSIFATIEDYIGHD